MTLEVAVVGALCAVAVVLTSVAWHLWVHPDLVLALLADRQDAELAVHEARAVAALRGMRWAAALSVFAVGFTLGVIVVLAARSNGHPWFTG